MDTVGQTFNDMGIAPELINRYSEHAKSILPEFGNSQTHVRFAEDEITSNTNSQRPDVNRYMPDRVQSGGVPGLDIQGMSPEEQMRLMQKIQNTDFEQEAQKSYSNKENVRGITDEGSEQTAESSDQGTMDIPIHRNKNRNRNQNQNQNQKKEQEHEQEQEQEQEQDQNKANSKDKKNIISRFCNNNTKQKIKTILKNVVIIFILYYIFGITKINNYINKTIIKTFNNKGLILEIKSLIFALVAGTIFVGIDILRYTSLPRN